MVLAAIKRILVLVQNEVNSKRFSQIFRKRWPSHYDNTFALKLICEMSEIVIAVENQCF